MFYLIKAEVPGVARGILEPLEQTNFIEPVKYVRLYNSPVLQLSYREIFIFLNIPGKDFTGSFTKKK